MDDFDELIKKLEMENRKTPQRDAAIQMIRQAQLWARRLAEIESE